MQNAPANATVAAAFRSPSQAKGRETSAALGLALAHPLCLTAHHPGIQRAALLGAQGSWLLSRKLTPISSPNQTQFFWEVKGRLLSRTGSGQTWRRPPRSEVSKRNVILAPSLGPPHFLVPAQ